MAVIDRVKERVETDLTDEEIQFIIDNVNLDVIQRFGPHADPSNPISVELAGLRKNIVVDRPIDVTNSLVVEEEWDAGPSGLVQITLGVNDYRVWPGGYRLQRRQDGVGSNPRRTWGDRVNLTYTPVNDGNQREEVIIKVVMLTIEYDATSTTTVGDASMVTKDFNEEKENLMRSIAPRRGLYMQ